MSSAAPVARTSASRAEHRRLLVVQVDQEALVVPRYRPNLATEPETDRQPARKLVEARWQPRASGRSGRPARAGASDCVCQRLAEVLAPQTGRRIQEDHLRAPLGGRSRCCHARRPGADDYHRCRGAVLARTRAGWPGRYASLRGARSTGAGGERAKATDLVAIVQQGEAGAHAAFAVALHQAVKAVADPAKEPSPLAPRPGRPPRPFTVAEQGASDRHAVGGGEFPAVEAELEPGAGRRRRRRWRRRRRLAQLPS